jgi:hypothetical protein
MLMNLPSILALKLLVNDFIRRVLEEGEQHASLIVALCTLNEPWWLAAREEDVLRELAASSQVPPSRR